MQHIINSKAMNFLYCCNEVFCVGFLENATRVFQISQFQETAYLQSHFPINGECRFFGYVVLCNVRIILSVVLFFYFNFCIDFTE